MRQINKVWYIGGVIIIAIAGLWWWSVATKPFYPEITSPRPAKGLSGAVVQLEEFSDFQCPACKAAQPIIDDVIETFGDRVHFTYKHYPLVQAHTKALTAAMASECVNDQGKFWEYHDILFDKQPALSRAELITYATQVGVDVTKFTVCLDSRAKLGIVRADMAEGDKLGVQGTPSFFLNGVLINDWFKLKELIQAKLAGG